LRISRPIFFVFRHVFSERSREMGAVLLCGFFDSGMIEKERRKGRRIWKKDG